MRHLFRLTAKLILRPLRCLISQTGHESTQSGRARSERSSESRNKSSFRDAPTQTPSPSPTSSKAEAPVQLSRAADERLDTQSFAKRLRVSGQSVRNWRRDGKIHGVRSGRGYVFAASQIMSATNRRPAQLVPGLEDVFKRFASTDEAWAWLTTDMEALRTSSKSSDTPLQALRQGRREVVLQLI